MHADFVLFNHQKLNMNADQIFRNQFRSPIYDRYFQHYAAMHEWFRKHRNVVLGFAPTTTVPQDRPAPSQSRGTKRTRTGEAVNDVTTGLHYHRTTLSIHSSRTTTPEARVAEPEVDFEEEDLVVSEDVLEFFEQTQRHREELRRRRREDARNGEGENAKYESLENLMLTERRILSTETPQTAVQHRIRTEELRELYGEAAAKIHGMETALQLSFDRFRDQYEPKLWPNIPLRI